MRLVNTFINANDIEGTFVEVGFGRGKSAKTVFNAMNDSTLTKRNSYLIDSFKGASLPTVIDLKFNPSLQEGDDPGRLQVAMDMRFELGNEYSIAVLKSYVGPTLASSYHGGPIAVLHIDLPSYSATVEALDVLHPFMNKDAIVYVGGYGDSLGITNAVDNFLEDNNLGYQLYSENYSTYLKNKVAPVFYTQPRLSRHTPTPENFIPVTKVKVTPFADRYIKPIIEKFKPKEKILEDVINVLNTVDKDTDIAPEELIPVTRPTIKPFKDRYNKVETPKFKAKKVITPGLDLLDKKVTK